LQQMPGAKIVGASTDLPLESGWTHLFTPEGYQPPPGANLNRCNHSVILGDYLQTMGVPLIRGRYFTEQDNENSVKVLIVSESLAKRYWPKQDAIGKRLKWGTAESKDPWLTIVGVVGDVKPRGLDMETTQHTYEPYLQLPGSGMNVAVRTSVEPESLAAQLRRTVWLVDAQLAVARLRTMEEVIRDSTLPRRFSLLLLGSFALLALVLAAIGIYGVISYAVVRRVHEIGIRMALGAQERDVMKLVLKQSMAQLGAGIAIGIAGALAVTRLLGSLLYGVRPTDPTTIGGVVVLLAGVAVAASLIPARRAMKVDPMVALRYE
jgi:putative ABC transport system permease protein